MSSTLSSILTLKLVKRLAGVRAFQRGRDYCDRDQVRSLVSHDDMLTATVCGTVDYAVRLSAEDGELQPHCSCQSRDDAGFCQHAVAVALAWLEADPAGPDALAKKRHLANDTPQIVSFDDLRPWLLEQTPATLAAYLLETAEYDDRLRDKLLRGAARATAKGIDLNAYRRSLERATRSSGFIDYRSAGGYSDGVRRAIEPLQGLLVDSPEEADRVINLTEFTLRQVETAMEQADDSDGEIGGLLEELQELHVSACRIARPDPEELAKRLFQWEIEDQWDVFYNAVETYAPLLGSTGLATYRRLAEAAWQKLPVRKPNDSDDHASNRFRLTSIMESLARTSGDVDAIAAIKAKDLSYPYNYLQIAQLYHEAKRPDEALAWAERGLKAFPALTDMRLHEFLADEYLQRNRPDDALALIWRPFGDQPSLVDYQRLKTYAERTKSWPHWRDRALTTLRQRIEKEKTGQSRRDSPQWALSARTTLVRIFLSEKDAESAWTTGHGHPLAYGLALELATVREQTHPEDALPIYLHEVNTLIDHKSNRSYEDAVRRLKHIKSLYSRLGLAEGWNALLTRLRTQHKAKRNFIALAANL